MVEINEKILEKYGIYKTRELKPNEEKKLLKMKKQIEKLINMKIERLYVINESAWGKEAEKKKYSICILVDKRHKDLKPVEDILADFCEKNNIVISFWTLCQYEKRKNMPTEEDYYIERHGIKVYDSGKQTEINEKIQSSEYAAQMEYFKAFRSYVLSEPDYVMGELVRIYTLKIGYAVIGRKSDLKRDCEFAKLVTEDKKAIEIIDKYLQVSEKSEKEKIVAEFEAYLKKVKQVKFSPRLEEKPTMKVYEKLLKRKEKYGTLDIKTLTRDDLYIMYIIQGIGASQIAQLYNVNKNTLKSKRDNWNIKSDSEILFNYKDLMIETIKKVEQRNGKYVYAFLKKIGMMNFEKCALPILEYMLDDSTYLLKEFWQFTKEDELGILEACVFNDKKDPYYKASICVDLFLQNELIEEVDYKQYKITKKGKELVWFCYRKDIDEITIPVIYKRFKKVNYHDLYYTEGYPEEIEKVSCEKLSIYWENYCKKYFPELLEKENLPLDNKEEIYKIESTKDIAIIWMFLFLKSMRFKNNFPKEWEEEIFITLNDILTPIQDEIKEKYPDMIVSEKKSINHLDITNLSKYAKIDCLEDIIKYAAVSCAYLLKMMKG